MKQQQASHQGKPRQRNKPHLSEEQRLECEQILETALEIANLGIWKLPCGTDAIHCSARGKAQLGYPANVNLTYTMLDERIISVVDNTGQPLARENKTVQAMVEQLQEKKEYYAEYQVTWPEDSPHWIEIRGKVLASQKGKRDAIVVVTRDITTRKQEQQRRDAYISKVRHELKTPLTTIKGFTQLLRRRMKKVGLVEQGEMLTRIEEQVDIMDTLINAMRDAPSLQSQNRGGFSAYTEQPFSFLSSTEPNDSSGDDDAKSDK